MVKRMFGRKRQDSPPVEDMQEESPSRVPVHHIELGSIEYVNLTPDGKHGDFDKALSIARETGKPIFANFVEWSG